MDWKTRIKREWDANPLNVIAVTSAAAVAACKMVDTVASARSKNAYAKQANRRNRH